MKRSLLSSIHTTGELDGLLETASESMRPVLSKIRAVAPTRTAVLLHGETGSGKGLFAKSIHQLSSRSDGPFVAVHCGALPDTLLESELFGHERGAFTGAVRQRHGKFELATGGTLFLDEIGTISNSAQIKLLDVLQERRFQRVGGESNIEVDVRLVTATNGDLAGMMRTGSFRSDLYYRLNVFPIEIPPLRERKEDIPRLVRLFLRRCNDRYPKEIQGVTPEVMQSLQAYSWPGNVRELENVLERAHVLASGPVLGCDVIPKEILTATEGSGANPVTGPGTLTAVRRAAVETVERRYLSELLASHKGRIDASARAAGVTPRQLHKLLSRYGIRKEWFKPGPGSAARS